jgi:hypothetical protein
MLDTFKFILVEDKEMDRREVLFKLRDSGFLPENNLGVADTYEKAKSLIEEHADELDVLFLDLNIPRNDSDGRPEKGHGGALLDLVHKDMNRRAGVDIRVIVVSGESLNDGMQDRVLYDYYQDTLVGIVQKTKLPEMLKASIKRLKKDPLRNRVRRNEMPILESYDVLVDPAQPIKERLKCARTVAIHMVRNWAEYRNQQPGSCDRYADDLYGLIKNCVEECFSADDKDRRYVRASNIATAGGWGCFLWRGSMVQHLYAINSYRNLYEHIHEQPFRNVGQNPDEWNIPQDVLSRAESGETIGKIVELLTKELLEWYLPWHEQVYLPWIKAQSVQSGGQR